MSVQCVKGCTIFAGLYTLIQGLVWAVLAIYAISIFTCQTPVPFKNYEGRSTTGYLFYLSYLKGQCSGSQFEPESASRTYFFMMTYSILSSIWLPTSVLILVAAAKNVTGNHKKYFYLPWILVTILVAILDVVATVIYSIDISRTLSVSDYLNFIDAPSTIKLHGAKNITVMPAIIMTLICSRVIVLWLVNVFLAAFAIQALRTYPRKPKSSSQQPEIRQIEDRYADWGRQRWVQMKPPMGNVNQGFEHADDLQRIEPTHIEVRPKRNYMGPRYDVPFEEESTQLEELPKHEREADKGVQNDSFISGEPVEKRSSVRRVYDAYGNKTDERMTPPYIRELDKALASRNEVSGYQKPWSYTQPPVEAIKVKHDTVRGLEKPPIPLPDYSVRVNKKATRIDVIGLPTAYNNNNTNLSNNKTPVN